MILLSWNCRGLGNSRTVQVLRDIVKSQKPNLIFLFETLSVGKKIEELSSKLGYVHFFAVDRQGRSGGLVVFWSHTKKCRVVDYSQNHIDLIIEEGNGVAWRMTCFYGFSEHERRQDSWNFLRMLASSSQLPWCIFGDFNDLLHSSDKKDKHPYPQRLMDGFRCAINDSSLVELELKGGDFTWEKSKGTQDWVRER